MKSYSRRDFSRWYKIKTAYIIVVLTTIMFSLRPTDRIPKVRWLCENREAAFWKYSRSSPIHISRLRGKYYVIYKCPNVKLFEAFELFFGKLFVFVSFDIIYNVHNILLKPIELQRFGMNGVANICWIVFLEFFNYKHDQK